ncbi:glycosyltransferase [Psychroflexus sp. ALD_RP9]|uniref:glycosyltransferase n=1 Tax=Psychroflexus sp. ALD_RP9 TaxID=2777186 RepID=UPI001A8E93D7|nr:glycosyltransferase [Psychroflexus sp. ALD_RP9]QSS96697.1 glycosyltransferase [Psychroflexus sp. ALD_RP9]QSS96698.1 glycosyltransferase [Psychroflexus sp. ALD_RP9]
MNILIVENSIIPFKHYGGTQRVIWYLGKELYKLGHKVTYLVKKGSKCDFGKIIFINNDKELYEQIPNYIDIVHFNNQPADLYKIDKPYIITMHGNLNNNNSLDYNTVFVSKNHAERYNSNSFVYNGLDWNDYSKPNFNKKNCYHFLGKASWGVKNLKGSIQIIKGLENNKLLVLGGKRFSERVLKMGPAYFLSTKVDFKGMVGGKEKENYLNMSKGLIFPVLWHEPFGLAIIESLFYGCPVFGTPYGSLPELINNEVGFLSTKKKEIKNRIKDTGLFNNKYCHEYALENFNSKNMAKKYLEKYSVVLNGEKLNLNKPELKNIQNQKYLKFE